MIVNVTSERRPRLYFDQFALYDFASTPALREPFLARFAAHGELMFSHTNMMEVGALQGRSASLVRDFLARIGTHWIPLEYEFDKVVTAENKRVEGAPHPALSERLLEFVYRSRTPGEPITLDSIIDEFSRDDPETHRRFLARVRIAMAANVATWQRCTPEEIDRKYPIPYRAGPTLHLMTRIIRALIQEAKSHRWQPNDAFDFSHALVPLVYADAVFLDKQWKKRIERLKLDVPFARVFYAYEAPVFLDWFDRFEQPVVGAANAGAG